MGANNSKSSGKADGKTCQFEALSDDLAKQVFTALPIKEKAALARTSQRSHGLFSQHIHPAKLLMLVAHGEEESAALMLASKPELLLERADVTDYSGRTFKHITAYEYAYWAKDTHMCRMFEAHMDEKTKAAMLKKVTAIDTVGLTYEQGGHVVEHSKNFDMTPLKTALTNYVTGWSAGNDENAMEEAWMRVGLAQRDVPVHVINEYCKPDRSFIPRPEFNVRAPIALVWSAPRSFLPAGVSDTFGPGGGGYAARAARRRAHQRDLAVERAGGCERVLVAVSDLDEVRTAELTQSRANLRFLPTTCSSDASSF